MAAELERGTDRLDLRLSYGTEDVPKPEARATMEPRAGLVGSLEDTYDELAAVAKRLADIAMRIGSRGEGPRGQLDTPRPPGREWATAEPVAGRR